MGSTPVQQLELDLNGTGIYVDVTAYVDMAAGLGHTFGRTDWTAAEVPPGTLTFVLDNVGGRFTPGFTTVRGGVYIVGCKPGVSVRWTCGTRVRMFEMGSPELVFEAGTPSGSTVTVSCVDVLARVARRTLGSMLHEHTMIADPICYYPLTDVPRSEAETGGVLSSPDMSRYDQPPIVWGRNPRDELGWGKGEPVPTDNHGMLLLNESDTVLSMQTDYPLFDSGYLPGPLKITSTHPTVRTLTTGTNAPQHYAWATSAWFTIRDLYLTPFGAVGSTDGPYVSLFRLGGAAGVTEGHSIDVVWHPGDQRILLFIRTGSTAQVLKLSATTYNVQQDFDETKVLHHLFITYRANPTAPYNFTVKGWVDGNELSSSTTTLTAPFIPAGFPLVGLGCGDENGRMVGGTGASTDVYRLSGSIGHLAVFGPPDVQLTSAVVTSAASMVRPDYAYQLSHLGTDGHPEYADVRFDRLASYLPGVAFARSGDPQPANLGPSDTEGKSLLSALSLALSGEGAQMYVPTVAGVPTVTTRLDSLQRSLTPRFTVDVDQDGTGTPDLSFDQSGAVSTVVVNGAAGVNVTFTVASPLVDDGTSTSVDSAFRDPLDLMGVAQFRATLGRPDVMLPSMVTIDATTARTSGLTTALLNDLRAGDTISVTGLPAAVIGYSTLSCLIVGVTESHNLQGSLFSLKLQPLMPSTFADMGERLAPNDGVLLVGFCKNAGLGTNLVAADTTMQYAVKVVPSDASDADLLTEDAADYPIYVKVDSEIMQLTAPPTFTFSTAAFGGTCIVQNFTGVVRGCGGTTAASHTWSYKPSFILDDFTADPGPYAGF